MPLAKRARLGAPDGAAEGVDILSRKFHYYSIRIAHSVVMGRYTL